MTVRITDAATAYWEAVPRCATDWPYRWRKQAHAWPGVRTCLPFTLRWNAAWKSRHSCVCSWIRIAEW